MEEVEPTRIQTQEVDSASDEDNIESRFSEIVPGEERASVFGRIESSP